MEGGGGDEIGLVLYVEISCKYQLLDFIGYFKRFHILIYKSSFPSRCFGPAGQYRMAVSVGWEGRRFGGRCLTVNCKHHNNEVKIAVFIYFW